MISRAESRIARTAEGAGCFLFSPPARPRLAHDAMLLRSAARSSAARALRQTLPLRAFSSQAAEPTTDKLWIFDTTLRDGEQSPGATLNIKEKVDIGHQLSRLGVDICEAGFPIASQGDFEAVREVAKTAGQVTEGRHGGTPMRIAGLSRANKKDIERC